LPTKKWLGQIFAKRTTDVVERAKTRVNPVPENTMVTKTLEKLKRFAADQAYLILLFVSAYMLL
jgi:hypothetical protein